jgi:hypothetical protein
MTRRLLVFEGADGCGKTTLARAVAKDLGALYVHHGPYSDKGGDHLATIYATSMLPAVTGDRDVVLDRCWVSEVPYGLAFRGGLDRLGYGKRLLLERLAGACASSLFLCRPPWHAVTAGFRIRHGDEMLDDETQLRQVYEWYDPEVNLVTSLPTFVVNPFGAEPGDTSCVWTCLKCSEPSRPPPIGWDEVKAIERELRYG